MTSIRAEQKATLADTVAEAERQHLSDPAFRHELESWIRERIAESADRESEAYRRLHRTVDRHRPSPHPELFVQAAASAARSFAAAETAARHEAERVKASPLMALLTTGGDEPVDWLAAGQGLQRMLLVATGQDIAVSYLNASTELPGLRPRLSAAFGDRSTAQVLLRLGYRQEELAPTVRRPVNEVLL